MPNGVKKSQRTSHANQQRAEAQQHYQSLADKRIKEETHHMKLAMENLEKKIGQQHNTILKLEDSIHESFADKCRLKTKTEHWQNLYQGAKVEIKENDKRWIEATKEAVAEHRLETCCLCQEHVAHRILPCGTRINAGHSADPVAKGVCCDACQMRVIMPFRMSVSGCDRVALTNEIDALKSALARSEAELTKRTETLVNIGLAINGPVVQGETPAPEPETVVGPTSVHAVPV